MEKLILDSVPDLDMDQSQNLTNISFFIHSHIPSQNFMNFTHNFLMYKTFYLSRLEKWKQEGWLSPTKRASAAKIN